MVRLSFSLFLIIPCLIYLIWFLSACAELKKVNLKMGLEQIAQGGGIQECSFRGMFSNPFLSGNLWSVFNLLALTAFFTIVIVLWNFIYINTRSKNIKD